MPRTPTVVDTSLLTDGQFNTALKSGELTDDALARDLRTPDETLKRILFHPRKENLLRVVLQREKLSEQFVDWLMYASLVLMRRSFGVYNHNEIAILLLGHRPSENSKVAYDTLLAGLKPGYDGYLDTVLACAQWDYATENDVAWLIAWAAMNRCGDVVAHHLSGLDYLSPCAWQELNRTNPIRAFAPVNLVSLMREVVYAMKCELSHDSPTTRAVFIRLSPTWTGTTEELYATARALSAQ